MNIILEKIGLNEREKNDFIYYWDKNLPYSNYYLFSLLDENLINEVIELHINPKPDTLKRIWFGVILLDEPLYIKEPEFDPIIREGFTVVEWGLCFLDKRIVFNEGSSNSYIPSFSLLFIYFSNSIIFLMEEIFKKKNKIT